MAQEEKIEKKVAVKEKPLGGTEVSEETKTQQVKEQPSTTAQPSQAESVAGKSGEAIGTGLKKVGKVLGEFTAGVSKEMKSDEPPRQAEREAQGAQQTEQRSEQRERTQEGPQAKVTEKEKVEKKVTKNKMSAWNHRPLTWPNPAEMAPRDFSYFCDRLRWSVVRSADACELILEHELRDPARAHSIERFKRRSWRCRRC